MAQKILDSTLENASFNVIFQIVSRCVTFLINAIALRFITQDVVGIINVRLLLLESTVLFLSREAFRKSVLSQAFTYPWQQIINLVWLTVPLSIIVSVTLSYIWLNVLSIPPLDITSHYSIGVWSVSIGCVIEMFGEPMFIISQAYSFIKLRIILASIVVLIRSLIFILIIIACPQKAIIAFSIAQITANFFYTFGFYYYFYIYIRDNSNVYKMKNTLKSIKNMSTENNFRRDKAMKSLEYCNKINDGKIKQYEDNIEILSQETQSSHLLFDKPFSFSSLYSFLPRSVSNENWIHADSAHLTWGFFKQGMVKQILSEGEHYVMTLFSVMTFKEQGIYIIVNNFGSLVARFLFRPVEDSLYFYFTQSVGRDAEIKEQNQMIMKEVCVVLHNILNCFVNLGLIIFVFGQSYSTLLLYLYGGKSFSSGQGPILLQAQSFAVLLLGINGITECYTFSSMTAHQLNEYNYVMAILSVLFLLLSWGLTTLCGGVGFILANCCNMLARIFHSIIFIRKRYSRTQFQPLKGLVPSKLFFSILCLVLVITKITENYCSRLEHFLVGIICFIAVILVWSYEKQEIIGFAIQKWMLRNKVN